MEQIGWESNKHYGNVSDKDFQGAMSNGDEASVYQMLKPNFQGAGDALPSVVEQAVTEIVIGEVMGRGASGLIRSFNRSNLAGTITKGIPNSSLIEGFDNMPSYKQKYFLNIVNKLENVNMQSDGITPISMSNCRICTAEAINAVMD